MHLALPLLLVLVKLLERTETHSISASSRPHPIQLHLKPRCLHPPVRPPPHPPHFLERVWPVPHLRGQTHWKFSAPCPPPPPTSPLASVLCLCSADLTNTNLVAIVCQTPAWEEKLPKLRSQSSRDPSPGWWEGSKSGPTGRAHPPGSLDSPPSSSTPSRPPTTCPLHACPRVSLLSHHAPRHPPKAVLSHYLLAQKLTPTAPPALANRHPLPYLFPPRGHKRPRHQHPHLPTSLLSWLVVSTRDHPTQASTHLLHSSPGPGFPPHLGLHLQLGPLQWPLGPTEVCRPEPKFHPKGPPAPSRPCC